MKPSTDLPAWVPKAITHHYDTILTGEDGEIVKNGPYAIAKGLIGEYGYTKDQLAPIITSLCNDPEMESVWRRLRKEFKKRDWKGWEKHFFYFILIARYRRSPWDKLTRKQRQKQYENIVQQARELAANLREYELDHPVWKFIQPREFEGAIERHPFTQFTPGYRDSEVEGRERPGLFLPGNPPYIADVLERLCDKVSTEKLHELTLVERDSGLGKDYIMFVRRMGSYFTEFLDTPHYDIVATLTRVLLKVEVDANTVWKTISKSQHDKENFFNR